MLFIQLLYLFLENHNLYKNIVFELVGPVVKRIVINKKNSFMSLGF